MTRGPAGRDTRKFRRVDLEVSVLVTDAARKVRKPIRFSSIDVSCGGTSKDRFPWMGLEFLDLSTDDRAALHARTS
jgi:hypothetical protein